MYVWLRLLLASKVVIRAVCIRRGNVKAVLRAKVFAEVLPDAFWSFVGKMTEIANMT